jgi:Ca-activated chloride channel family protein
MITRSLTVSVVIGGLVLGGPALAQRFRAGVDIVALNVTVTAGDGRYVTDLGKDDFQVFEDGIHQEISFFSRTQLPIALALLLDTSASMEEKLKTAQEAAVGFARRLRPEDVAEVIDFDSRVEILQGFTADVPALEAAIRKTTAGGSTSLYNALYISLKELRKVQSDGAGEIRRQAVVVLSDGEDTSSLLGYDEVLELAKRSETAIYAIGLRAPREETGKGFHEAEFVLRQLSQETGGRAFFPETIGQLSAIYDQISEELANQYAIGYASSNPRRDGLWRRIVVRVSRTGVQARTKQGYYAPTAQQ